MCGFSYLEILLPELEYEKEGKKVRKEQAQQLSLADKLRTNPSFLLLAS